MVSLTLLPKTLVLVLIITFSVTLTNLPVADGYFSASGKLIQFELHPGETQMLTWGITNNFNHTINIEVYAEGDGSELFVFEELHVIPAHTSIYPEIFVIVPEDHPTDIEYHPSLFALHRGEAPRDEGGELSSGAIVHLQAKNLSVIKIGDNPIFTPPVVKAENELPTPPVVKEAEQIEEVPEETMEEKIARIQAGNEANAPAEVQVDDTWEESFEEEAVPDYEPEPYVDEPTITDSAIVETPKIECNFIEVFLSWFGIVKC